MAKFNLGVTLSKNIESTETWKLGAKDKRFTDEDKYKAVKLSKTLAGTMELAAKGDEIEGFVEVVERFTQDGQAIGSVVRHGDGVRVEVQFAGSVALGDYVVAGDQGKVGTSVAQGKLLVEKAKAESKWRVIRADSTTGLIEAV